MNEPFTLPVIYRGKDLEFEAILQSWAHGYRFLISVEGIEMIFERDDEGNYRAIIPPEHIGKLPEKGLIQAIGEAIGKI